MPDRYSTSRYFPGLQLPKAYNFEANRLASYKNWANPHVSAFSLAKEGLVYSGSGNMVKCCWCSFSCSNWTSGQFPREIHKKHSPDCPFFTQTVSATIPPNIFIPNQKKSKNAMAELLQTYFRQTGQCSSCTQESSFEGNRVENVRNFLLGVALRPVQPNRGHQGLKIPRAADGSAAYTANIKETVEDEMYPQFSSPEQRLNTFKGFPLRQRPLSELLCHYGFFYTGHHDIVICYYCGLSLFQWLLGDDPKIAHARWRPDCRHLHNVVSTAFIEAIENEMYIIGIAH